MADIHGNWTAENAKSRLHQFMQITRIRNIEYKYSPIGPDHNRYSEALSQRTYGGEACVCL